ncbi:MAG: hypothetical protein R6V85_07005 [Polyangia bacterium]
MAARDLSVDRTLELWHSGFKSRIPLPIIPVRGSPGFVLLYQDFIASIKNNSNPLIDGKEGKKSLEIILMAYQSQKENKPIIYQKDLKISTTDFIGMLDN